AGAEDRRQSRRLPVRLRVSYTARGVRRVNFSRDLSEGGIFVGSAEPLAGGEKTHLLILPPGGQVRPGQGRGEGARAVFEPQRGMGIRFLFADSGERDRFVAFVTRLEEQWLAGELPPDTVPPQAQAPHA